jgi:hypothetical protein
MPSVGIVLSALAGAVLLAAAIIIARARHAVSKALAAHETPIGDSAAISHL